MEEALKVKLPDDFKDFIEHYGSGKIDHFISVLNPFSLRPTLNLLDQSKRQLDDLRELHEDFGEQNPFKLYPAAGGLFPVAITDNGDIIHWLMSVDPSDWTIVVNEARSPDYQHFSCRLTDFLTGTIENQSYAGHSQPPRPGHTPNSNRYSPLIHNIDATYIINIKILMRIMADFSSFTSSAAVEDACQQGLLSKALLLPLELGGQNCPENVVFIPPHALEIKSNATAELLSAIRMGMSDVSVVPEYRGMSFVPTKIKITAAESGMLPGYQLEIEIW